MKRFFLIMIVASLSLSTSAFAGDSDPDQIRLSFEGDATSSLTVAWRTKNVGIVDSVCRWGESPAYGNQTTGITYTFAGATGLHHKVQIEGLQPRTVYHLSCGDGDAHMFGDRTFITAPEASDICEPIRFVVLGDSRSSINEGASLVWSTVMDWATDEAPDFIVFTGDAIAEGDHVDGGWDDWFEKSSDIGNYPMMMLWGNHDNRTGSPFPELFHAPTNEVTGTDDFWEMRYGALHFFGLDTEYTPNRLPVQAAWMEEKLTDTDAIWKMAAFHESAYSSGTTHGSNEDIIDAWSPIFDAHHLDIAFQAHDHIYERTKPIYADEEAANYNEGTMYVVSGGAGAFCNPILNVFNWFYELGIGTYHYTLVEITYDTMTLTARETNLGLVIDEITVRKPGMGQPTAFFTGDFDLAYVGEPVNFDGSDSSDPCGVIDNYHWDFGDGQSQNGPAIIDHTYQNTGEVTVTLTVTDIDGNTAQYSETFTVDEAPIDDDTVDDDTVDDDVVDDDTVDDDVVDDDAIDDDATDDDATDDDGVDDDAIDDDATDDDGFDDDMTDDDATGDDDDDDDGCGC